MLGMRRAIVMLTIAGQDVTSLFQPRLIELKISLTEGGESDTLTVTLDDRNGSIQLPKIGSEVTCLLSWMNGGGSVQFTGRTDEPTSTGSRDGGMLMKITARSADMGGEPKAKDTKHKDKGKFKEVAEEFGKKAGLQVKVADKLGSIERDYWSMKNESFLQWGQRHAEELGATFKVMGKKAVFVEKNGKESASGKPLGQVMAAYGDNLIEWSITPKQMRPQWEEMIVRYFDPQKVEWKEEKKKIEGGGGGGFKPKAKHIETKRAANKEQAKQKAESNAAESEDGKGAGSITIVGDGNAQPQARCMIQGVRAGINGNYKITSCTHTYSRNEGWITECELSNPQGEAGSDSRQASNK